MRQRHTSGRYERRTLISTRDAAFLAAILTVMVVSSYAVMEMDKHDAQPKAQAASVSVVTTSPVDLAKEVVEASAERCPLEVSTFYDVPMDIDLQAYITNDGDKLQLREALLQLQADVVHRGLGIVEED